MRPLWMTYLQPMIIKCEISIAKDYTFSLLAKVIYRLIRQQTVVYVVFYAPLLELIQTRGRKKEVDLVLY